MCRIAGFWDFKHRNDNLEKNLIQMRDTMVSGGPDDAGLYIDAKHRLALGHRRLSILDLSSAARQPMTSSNGRYQITYNGEIYNFHAIKLALEKDGVKFYSHSDTEVILASFEKWGFSCVNQFRGMWSFALWDSLEKKLILCRDRVGVKPLYWHYSNGLFIFSSELKAMVKHPHFHQNVSPEAISLFLKYGYISAPYSIYEKTYKLEPGHFLIVNKDESIQKKQYWDVQNLSSSIAFNDLGSDHDITDECEKILTESFKLRLVSDVPVGIFLSGGIDSSLVATLLRSSVSAKLKTFTIGFKEPEYDEAQWAKKLAKHLNTDHVELYCTPQEALNVIPLLPQLFDEPFGDASAIPTFLVSRLAKTQVKVALSADGGDEQFCGYSHYIKAAKLAQFIQKLPLKKLGYYSLGLLPPQIVSLLYAGKKTDTEDRLQKFRYCLKTNNPVAHLDIVNQYFLKNDLKKLGLPIGASHLKITNTDLDPMSAMMRQEFLTYLPDDVLVKVDRTTMGVSLEGREPFLDQKILEFSARLPMTFKYRNGTSKYILKQILYKHIPKEFVDRPKQGFRIPIHQWSRNELKGEYHHYIQKKKFAALPINHLEHVDLLMKQWKSGRSVHPAKLWLLYVLSRWTEHYI